jgi:hypothetical protein
MLQGAIEQLSAELYQKDIRFVPELIQAITLVPVAFFVTTMPCELSLHLSFVPASLFRLLAVLMFSMDRET